jgi:hypothetical protein
MTKKDPNEVPGHGLPEQQQSTPQPAPQAGDELLIPGELAKEIRRLVHDLSNGLEIIIQSSYLLSTSEIPEDSRQWVKLLEQGVQQSARINQEIRAYVIAHS